MQPTIIIMEQDYSNREFLEAFLKFEGFRVMATETTDTALALVQKNHPALILLDVHLPEGGSFAFYHSLKKMPGGAEIPVIAMTTSIMPSQQEAIESAGFEAFLRKPIDTSLLRIYLNYYIRQNAD